MHKSSIKIVFFSSSSSSPYDYLLFLYIAAAIDHTAGHLVVRVHYKENTTPPAIRNFRSFWRRGLHSFVLCPKQRAWHFPTGDFDERACHNLVPYSTKEKEGIAFYCRNLFTTRWSAARSQKGKEDESRPTVIPFQIFAWVSCVWFGLSLRSLSARPWKKRGKKRILGVWKCTLILFILNKKEKKVSSSLPSSSPLSKDLGGNQIREHKVEEEGPAISPKEPLLLLLTHRHRRHNVDGNNRERLLKPARGKWVWTVKAIFHSSSSSIRPSYFPPASHSGKKYNNNKISANWLSRSCW